MTDYTLGMVESRFADIIWDNAPMTTRELVERCKAELNWKRTTTYTVLKKLGEQGFFRLENGEVTALVTREDYESAQSKKFIEEKFEGSLPAFLAAFTRNKELSGAEIDEIQALIDNAKEG